MEVNDGRTICSNPLKVLGCHYYNIHMSEMITSCSLLLQLCCSDCWMRRYNPLEVLDDDYNNIHLTVDLSEMTLVLLYVNNHDQIDGLFTINHWKSLTTTLNTFSITGDLSDLNTVLLFSNYDGCIDR